MNIHGTKIRVSYYEASDGPRLMLFGPLEAEYGRLYNLFKSLSEESISVFLNAEDFVAFFTDYTVGLTNNASGKETGVHFDEKKQLFQWFLNKNDWLDLADLIQGLCFNDRSGHQYLATYPDDDVTIVLSKGEYGDEVLK